MTQGNNWLDENFTGYNAVHGAGVPVPQRKTLNFGSGLTVGDDPTTGVTTVTGTGSSPLFVTALVTTPPVDTSVQEFYIASAYQTPGDGGGGTFVWNPTDTRAADGGTIIAVTGIATGRWNRVFAGAVDPRWWGADSTGVADSTAALQASIAWKENAKGGEIHIVAGVYKVTSSIEWGVYGIVRGDGWVLDTSAPVDSTGTVILSTVSSGDAFTCGSTNTTNVQVACKLEGFAMIQASATDSWTTSNAATGLALGNATTTTTGYKLHHLLIAGFGLGYDQGNTEEVEERDLNLFYCTQGFNRSYADSGGAGNTLTNSHQYKLRAQYCGRGGEIGAAAGLGLFGGVIQACYEGLRLKPQGTAIGGTVLDTECCTFDALWIEQCGIPITGAANNGSGAIRLTLGVAVTGHIATGQSFAVFGVGGTTEANAFWSSCTVVDSTHVDLVGSTFTHAYTSGGTIELGLVIDATNETSSVEALVLNAGFSNCYLPNNSPSFVRAASGTNAGTQARIVMVNCVRLQTISLPSWASGCCFYGTYCAAFADAGTGNVCAPLIVNGAPYVQLPGATMTGALKTSLAALELYAAETSFKVAAGNSVGVTIVPGTGGFNGIWAAIPLCGDPNVPYPLMQAKSAISLGDGSATPYSLNGQQTASPMLVVVSTSLAGDTTIDLPTSPSPALFVVDLTGVSFNGHNVILSMGAASKTLSFSASAVVRVYSDGVGKLYYSAFS